MDAKPMTHEALIDLIGELGREVFYLLDDCETSGPVGEEVHEITTRGLEAVSAVLDKIDALPFEEPGYILGPGAMLQAALKQTFVAEIERLRALPLPAAPPPDAIAAAEARGRAMGIEEALVVAGRERAQRLALAELSGGFTHHASAFAAAQTICNAIRALSSTPAQEADRHG